MIWLRLITGLISIVQSLIWFLHDRKLLDQGIAKAALKHNQETLDAIAKAKAAKQSVSDAANTDPSSIMRDDEFKRPDK